MATHQAEHDSADRGTSPNSQMRFVAIRQFLLRAIARSASWALGLALAAWVVPGVAVSASGFVVALAIFSVAQTALSLWILKLPHGWASMLLGTSGLVLTVVGMSLAALSTHALSISGMTSWLAAVVVVWLVTTIGAILLFDVYVSGPGQATEARERATTP